MSELEYHEKDSEESDDQGICRDVGEFRVDLGDHAQVGALSTPQGTPAQPHKESSGDHGVEFGVKLRPDVRHVGDKGYSHCPLAPQRPETRSPLSQCCAMAVMIFFNTNVFI